MTETNETTCQPEPPARRRVYLAAPLFNPYQQHVIAEVTKVMEEVGVEVFSPLEESKPLWGDLSPAEATAETRQKVMQMNRNGIESSDLVFAWLGGWEPWREVAKAQRQFPPGNFSLQNDTLQRLIPSLPDTGVVWEMGYANALGVPTLAYMHDGDNRKGFNLMLSETVDATARGLSELREQLLAFKEAPTAAEYAGLMAERGAALASEGRDFNG